MATIYCDYLLGDDDTGAGTSGDPYQTITKASTGLSGGDEVRVAKSEADTALTGTLGFTINSTAVVGDGTLFESELVIGDFVKGGDGQYYEVVVITDDTHATLFKKYPGTTGASVEGFSLGVTSTGQAAASSTQIQVVSSEAAGKAARLKISGGWDLTGPTQDGQTYFRQMHSTFALRYGIGLIAGNKDYLEIERLHFLRYDRGIHIESSEGTLITSPNLLGCGDEAFYISACKDCEFVTPVVTGCADRGIHLNASYSNIFTAPICNSNNSYGLYLATCSNNSFTDVTCNSNGTAGVYSHTTHTCWFGGLTVNHNATGLGVYSGYAIIVSNWSSTGNSTDISVSAGRQWGDYPIVQVQHFNAAGDNRCYFEFGKTFRDTADARSTQCLKYDPANAVIYTAQSFFFAADSGVEQTLSAYVKDDAGFNGDIQAAIYFMDKRITGWSEWTPSTTYAQKTIVAGAGDVTEDGVLELKIKVRGTAGNVFVDDIAAA